MKNPKIKKKKVVYQTDWFSLEEKAVHFPDCAEYQNYYSVNEGNHVTIIAEDDKSNILLIKQYRPAVERFVIELPGGHAEDNDLEQSVKDELLEETGYEASQIEFIGRTIIDSGRNQGYLYCYYSNNIKQVSNAEVGIELLPVKAGLLRKMILNGEFTHALNLSAVFLASLRGMLIFE